MPGGQKVVAIAFDLNFRHAAEIFTGVSVEVRERGLNWQLMPLNFGFEARLMELAASGRLHGAIGTFVSDRWVEGLTACGVRAVNLFHFSKIRAVPTVGADDRRIGRMAAEHLRAQGARRFGFFGNPGLYATELREAAFREAIGTPGCARLRPDESLETQLRRLTAWGEPAGVYCTSDRLARRLVLAARKAALEVGRDLLVLGTDDDPAESVFAGIPISSIALPSQRIGRAAAARLDKLFGEPPGSAEEGLVDGAELIARESSLPDGPARLARRAAALIREQLRNPELDVNWLAHQTGASRRSLELAFRQHLGSSPYRYFSELRLARAQALLRGTGQSIAEVGRQCGYPEAQHFSAWFKKRTGRPPRDWRQPSNSKRRGDDRGP